MKITKLGHSCLLIETKDTHIIIDPGVYSVASEVKDIDGVLISHEHADHVDSTLLTAMVTDNPRILIVTNRGAGAYLARANLSFEVLEENQLTTIKNVTVAGFGKRHAPIYPSVPQVDNTGFLIDEQFFYPGDAFTLPNKPIQILALPVAGPWMKLAEAIDYAKIIKPRVCFPVHDGMLSHLGSTHILPKKELEAFGIQFQVLENGKSGEL